MPPVRPILIVEDDDALRQALVEQLAACGQFASVQAATLAQARCHLQAAGARIDAVILDNTLPDGSGRAFCAELRQHGHAMPVIMLSGSTDEGAVINGLNAGANDYVAKPFRAKELLARLQAQLRLHDRSDTAVFTIGRYSFHPAAKILTGANNTRIRLSAKEVDILKYLYQHAKQAVPRQTLMNAVWGQHAMATTHTLETHIYRLRQKIEAGARSFSLLIKVPGGYLLDPTSV